MDPVYQHLVTTLTTKFEVPSDRLSSTATLEELELDSLAVVELYVTLQEHWNIPLDDGDAQPEHTLQQVAQEVRALLDGRGAGRGAA